MSSLKLLPHFRYRTSTEHAAPFVEPAPDRVSSQREDSQLLFSVSDTGVGVPEEKLEQIFSAFFTTKPQGSGMGLAISRSIVESHGGRLWATANGGRGAIFYFTLPVEVVQRSRLD